tara:strand:+ start:873 stop:1295 length:423 start_codon:yes stop_codon:yes gene_type:complete
MKKTILYTLGGVAVALLGYFGYKRLTRPTEFFGDPDDVVLEPKSTKTNTNQNTSFPLKKGSRGKQVTALQKFLKDEGLGNLLGNFGANKDGVDGIFGNATESAVKEQQSPFETFKISFPKATFGQVSKEYYDTFIRRNYE